MFLKLTPKIHQGKPRVKLLTHRNAEQKEVIDHIVFLQKALDKPLYLDKLSLVTEESFHIMDLRAELFLSHDEAVKGGPWKRTVETLLSRKNQFLEDTTNKQILRNRWQTEERERKTCEKESGTRLSKEETILMTFGDLNQRPVVGLTVQELIPSLDAVYPWEPGEWNTLGAHTVITHSSVKIFTLLMSTNLTPSDASTETHTGQIAADGICTFNGFLWITEGIDAPKLLTD